MATKKDLADVVSAKLDPVHEKLNSALKTLHAELGSTGQTLRQAIADAADDRELNAAMATLKARLDAVDAKLAEIASTR